MQEPSTTTEVEHKDITARTGGAVKEGSMAI